MKKRSRSAGISLLESLITVLILAILAQLALPDFDRIRRQRQGSLVLQGLANSIFLARTAAARSGYMAVLCPTLNGSDCGGQWHQGVLVFVDRNDNQALDPDEELVDHLRFEKLTGTLRWRAFRSKPYLQITPLGFTRYQNGNFTWCDDSGLATSAHQLILNRTGRVRFARDRNKDGIRENSRGAPIDCPS